MEPFVGEIRMMGFVKEIYGWLPCDGRTLQTKDYPALYSLLGSRYGGDGKTTFCLPDLRGRTPMHFYGVYSVGAKVGTETVALATANTPPHSHGFTATTESADKPGVGTGSNRLLASSTVNLYGGPVHMVAMDDDLDPVGDGITGHDNMQPSVVTAYYIASLGLYPQRQ